MKDWRPGDFLYYLQCNGEDAESTRTAIAQQHPDYRNYQPRGLDVLLVAATAEQALQARRALLPQSDRINISAYGMEQNLPNRRFDEIHLLSPPGKSFALPPDLTRSAQVLNLHHFDQTEGNPDPRYRHYRWPGLQELTQFWGIFYGAMLDRPGLLPLDWSQYAAWIIPQAVGHTSCGRGGSSTTAMDALISATPANWLDNAWEAVLLMETGADVTLGEYMQMHNRLAAHIACEITPVTRHINGYRGYSLWLLAFLTPADTDTQ